MSDELKMCPFCGGEARYIYAIRVSAIVCDKCGAAGQSIPDYYEERDGRKKAIEAWNRRADDSWIIVKDRLPEKGGSYIVMSGKSGKVFTAHFWPDHKRWSGRVNETITHWRPLPEPPKEDE